MTMTRRDLILSGAGVAGLALLGAGAYEIFRPHHAPTPYDDLLDLLSSRDDAAKAGTLIKDIKQDAPALAKELRARLHGTSLAKLSISELDQGKLRIVEGWVLPDSVALLCALAMKAKPA